MDQTLNFKEKEQEGGERGREKIEERGRRGRGERKGNSGDGGGECERGGYNI